jgi:hypothetical protein
LSSHLPAQRLSSKAFLSLWQAHIVAVGITLSVWCGAIAAEFSIIFVNCRLVCITQCRWHSW